jgi:glyoxylase-like metal-dependent hydrolase (beta-lactamase superfamily II)
MPGDTILVGNVEITSLSDGILEFDLCNFFPSIPEEDWGPHRDHLTPQQKVRFNLASYLIRSEGRNILVDTGLGPRPADAPDTPWGKLMNDFQAHGVNPEDIDLVVMTHLHRDHVGWNLQSRDGKYVPTFPKARYWLSRADWEACQRPELIESRFPNAPTCVWPLEELGLIEFLEGEQAITGELTSLPTPGHTPGHMSIVISSQGERALVLGDVLHNTVQIEETHWVSRADIDPEQTRSTRRSMMDRLERDGSLVAAGHLPRPGFGRIVRLEGRRYWQAIQIP